MIVELLIPAFVAGLLTFLAPCILPLVPGYLGFISGVSAADLKDPRRAVSAKRKVFWNGWWYVVGFSAVFILLGVLAGLGGQALVAHRVLLGRIGGVLVILFGLYMVGWLKLPSFLSGRVGQWGWLRKVEPGTALSSLIFGGTFALGWTPCVGPILGSILVLAATGTTVAAGGLLLLVFSMGLGIPFLVIAAMYGWFAPKVARLAGVARWMSVVGGVFLLFIGVLLVTNSLGIWVSWFFRLFAGLGYEEVLLDYL